MGGGGRVLTALERNAQYLDNYVQFIKVFKHVDLGKGEIEINLSEVSDKAGYLRRVIIPIDFVQNNKKILLKLEKMLFETNNSQEILTYFKSNHKRFDCLHNEFLWNNQKNPEFLGKEIWDEFEKIISNNAEESYEYATLTRKRFELGEIAISKKAFLSLEYARNIIKGRFELGEESISECNEYLLQYSQLIGPLPDHLYNMMISNCIIG